MCIGGPPPNDGMWPVQLVAIGPREHQMDGSILIYSTEQFDKIKETEMRRGNPKQYRFDECEAEITKRALKYGGV